MSMNIDHGGPAFPRIESIDASSYNAKNARFVNYSADGMSLRDYFAAKAMQAQVMTDMVPGEACDALLDAAALADQDPTYRLALNSYVIADAMIKARLA